VQAAELATAQARQALHASEEACVEHRLSNLSALLEKLRLTSSADAASDHIPARQDAVRSATESPSIAQQHSSHATAGLQLDGQQTQLRVLAHANKELMVCTSTAAAVTFA
jgi:small-conductance mechanosensitive channel